MKTSTLISVVVTALIVISFVGCAPKSAAEAAVKKVNARDAQIKALFEENK